MGTVFVSHSTRDSDLAAKMKAWLVQAGYEQTFLDFDEQTGLRGGEAWEPRLYQEVRRAHVVLSVVTPNWVESRWCFAEFAQARALGKTILPVILVPVGQANYLPEIQSIDLRDWNAEGLARLANRLREVVTELAHGFSWDRTRSPYPGILSFDRDDAAIFFGRDEEIREVQEKLESHRVYGGNKFVLILGNSGSGKSSLLKAGVLPQLERNKRAWISLLPFRPERDPTANLAKSIANCRQAPDDWTRWRDQLIRSDAPSALSVIANTLRIGDSSQATIVVSVDQFEELFTLTDPQKRQEFLAILVAAGRSDLPYVLVGTARSDVINDFLQQSGIPLAIDSYLLRPMPMDRLTKVIDGPAAVAAIALEDNFSARVASDVQSPETLPLLAYALRELYEQHAKDHRFAIKDYEALAASAGLNPIESIISSRAESIFTVTAPSRQEMDVLKQAFVPHLVRVRDDGAYVRKPAAVTDLPRESLRLLDLLVDARLLTKRDGDGSSIIEVTHEALFRTWPLLQKWLNDEREFLVGKSRLTQLIAIWESAPASLKRGALLQGFTLQQAKLWLQTRRWGLDQREIAYIEDSLTARRTLKLKFAAAGLVGLAMVVGLVIPPLYRQYVQRTALHCDLYAAEPVNNVHVPGVAFDKIIPSVAIPECTRAVDADPNNPRLMHNLARSLDRDGQFPKAVDWYKRAAELNWAPSQNSLAVMLLTAQGTPFDPSQGIALIRTAALSGNADAEANYRGTDITDVLKANPSAMTAMQQALVAKGALQAIDISGLWQPATEAALNHFKQAAGLNEPGITPHILDQLGAFDGVSAALANTAAKAKQ
jgi:tetratricopeptide (TPR) repeat protein